MVVLQLSQSVYIHNPYQMKKLKIGVIVLILLTTAETWSQSITIDPSNSSLLNVKADTPYMSLKIKPDNNGGILFKNSEENEVLGGFWFDDSNGKFIMGRDKNSKAFVLRDGSDRIGLGTDSPQERLHINSNWIGQSHIFLTGSVPEIKFGNTNNAYNWRVNAGAGNIPAFSYFQIQNDQQNYFAINGEGKVGIGMNAFGIEEKLSVKGGNFKMEHSIPTLKLKSTLLGQPVGGVSFYDNNDDLAAYMKYDGGVFRINKNDLLTGINISETVGINDEPESDIALSVQGNLTNGSESTLQVKSLNFKTLIDGRSIQSSSKLFINTGSQDIEMGSTSGGANVLIDGYVQLGNGSAPLIKTKLLSTVTSSNSGITSVPSGVSDYRDVIAVHCLVQDSGTSKSYPPNNTDANLFYDYEVVNNAIILRNMGTTLRGKNAKIYITYTH